MNQFEKMRRIVRILLLSSIMLILILVGYETVIMINTSTIYPVVSSQQQLSQIISKNALIMKYGSTDDKVQAVSELQNTIPYFDSNQQRIEQYSLSANELTLVRGAQSDFVAIDTAAKAILSEKDTNVDTLQVDIVLSHERNFRLSMLQVNTLIVEEQRQKYYVIFGIIMIGKTLLIILDLCLLSCMKEIRKVFSKMPQMNTQSTPGDSD